MEQQRRNREDLQRAVIRVLQDNGGVFHKDKLWNMTSRYYGTTPAAKDFGVRKMSEMFDHLSGAIHIDPTGTMVLLGPKPRSRPSTPSEWSVQAASSTDQIGRVKKNCIILLKENKNRIRKNDFWSLYSKRFRESPSPRRMELASLEEFLGMCGEFEKEQDYIVLKSSRSEKGPSARSSPSPRSAPSPTPSVINLEQVKENCVTLLREQGGQVKRKKFWQLYTSRFRQSPCTRDLGVRKLEDIFDKFRCFTVTDQAVFLSEREQSHSHSESSTQSKSKMPPPIKPPLKPLWGVGAQAASNLSGSQISLSSPDSDSDSDDDVHIIEQPLSSGSRSSSVRSLGPEAGRSEPPGTADRSGFLSFDVPASGQQGPSMIFTSQQQSLQQQFSQQHSLQQQYEMQKQRFQQQQQQLLQLQQQQQLRGLHPLQQASQGQQQQLRGLQPLQQVSQGQQQQLQGLQPLQQPSQAQQHTVPTLTPRPLMSAMPRPMMLGTAVVPRTSSAEASHTQQEGSHQQPLKAGQESEPSAATANQQVSSGGIAGGLPHILPPPLPPQDPIWPPETGKLGIPPGRPRERKEVVAKPILFTRGRLTKEQVEAAAQDCIEVLVEAGDFVAPERITRLLLQRYGVNDLRDLGVPNVRFPYQIECINQHQRMICKVNASMEAFVNARSMCTLYELQESLREYTTDNAPFETLQLGPLQCLPDVYKLFKFPQDEMIPEITTSELLEVLSEYLSKHQKWTAKLDMQEVMAFFVEHYGVTSAYSLGIRIRSLPLAAQVLKKSHRDAAATRRSIITRFKANIENEVAEAFNKVKVTIMQRDDDGSMEVRRHYAQMTAEAVLMEMMQKFRILLSIDVPQSKAEHKRHHMLDAAVRQFLSVMQAEPLGRALLHLAVCVGSHDIQEAASMLSAPRQAEEAAAEGRGGGSGAAQTEKPKTSQPPSKAALMEKLKRYVERCLAQGTLTLSHLDRIEEKLLEDFGFPTFVTMGFGRFLHFLLHDHEPKALLEECGGLSLSSSSSSLSAGRAHMTEVLEFVRQCHAAGISQEADVERALCHQFQVPEVRALGFGNVRHLVEAAERPGKHQSKDYRILYETAISGRTNEPVRSKREVGVLGSQSRDAALACLQSCPLLEELGRWSHWSLVFEPQLGPLKDFLQKYGGVHTLNLEGGQKTVKTDIVAMETEPGRLLRLVSSTSPTQYEAAVSQGDARAACGHLASLVAGNRGLEHTPLALLTNHTRTALFALHTSSVSGGPGGPGQPAAGTDPAIQFVLSCLLLLPHRLCVAVANQVFLEPLAQVVGSSRSKTLLLDACRGPANTNTPYPPGSSQAGQRTMELALLGCMLGIQEWTQPLTDTFVFPPEAVTVVMPQQPAVRDELLGDDDEVVEEEEEESESESEEDDSSSASFLSDDDEDEKKQDEGVQVGAEPTATEGAVKVEDDESSGETDDSSEDDDEDEEEEEEIGEKQDEEQSMTVANASDDEEGEEVEKESDAEEEKTETEEDRCHRLINEIRREEFGVGIELNEDGKRLMRVQQERLGRSLDRLSRDLYTKDTHFVLELVQNADDNSYPEHLMASLEAGSDSEACPSVRFVIEQTGVTVLNNECGFREKDVRALCDVGRSTKGKHKYGYIGQKGIGFKSVFRVTSRPEVHSNGFHLCFDVSSGPMGYILPHWCEDSAPEPDWMTKIVLPLKEDMASEARSLAARFNDIHPSLLLFLHRLRDIHIDNRVEGSSLSMRRVDLGNNIVEIHHGHNTTDRWLVVKKRLDASNISLQAKSGVEVESTEIALAFPLGSKWRQRQAQVVPAKQPVFAFLPLRSYGFRFIVQGDFDVPSSREDVDRDSSWNQWLRNEIHTLFVEAFDIFRSHPEFSGLESLWAYLQFVPLEDEILDFFKPVATQILQRLRAFHCIPVATSATGKKDAIEWKLPSQTVMVQDSLLLEVISPELLQRHLGLHYLHRDAAAMLSPLLARSLGVETITSDHLVQIGRSLASSWGDHAGEDEVVQIAKWLACVYRSMDDFQENSTLISALQAMRVIPLSTGQLVSLDQVTVFMFSDSGHTEKPAGPGKRDALSVLRQDLRVVHGHLMATRDNEVNSQVTKLLLKMGVKQLSPYDIVHHHILPVLRSDQWQKKDRAVLVSYLVYIKEQRARNDSLVNMDELKSVARVLTNQGLKNPATDTVHFTPAYGISLDLQRQLPGHDWVLLDSQYLPHPASQMDVQTWQDFFTQLGVTTFLAVRRQQVTVRRAEMDNSPWAPLKDMLPATEVSYTIQDFVCEEFQQLVSNNTHESTRLQQMTVLFSLLDMAWESHYSRYISAQLLSGDGKTVLKETIPSSFAIALQSLPWVPGVETTVTKVGDAAKLDEKESLLAPSALYIPDPQIKRLLAHTVPYLAVRPSSSHGTFTRFLSIKSSVEMTVVRDALIDWGKRAADTPKEAATFCSTLSHLKQVYRHLFDYLPPKDAQDLFHHNPVIFVPQVPPGTSFAPHQQVVGRMLGRDEVWWQDTSGLFLKYRPTLLEFRSPLADRYPVGHLYSEMQDAFLRAVRLQSEPTLVDLAELLSLLASVMSLNTQEGLLTDTLTVYAKIGRDLSTSHPPNTLEFMQQQEQAKKVTEMLQKKKVLATKEQAWVSPDDKPMLADNTEFEKMFADKPGVHFLMEQPQSQQKRGLRSRGNTSQVNVEHIRVFLALFNIRQLSEEIVKEEIPTMFTPCASGQQYLQAIVPFIQRYLLNQYPDIHDLHREAGMADTLKNTMFVKVKGLEVRYSLKSIPEVYVIRPEKCVITGSHFYFQEKYVESYLEVNKEVARFFSNGDSDCMKDLRNFLMELQPVLTAGSDRDMSDLLSRNDVGPLPDDVEAWEVPAPKLPDPPKPPPPPPPPPAAFVTQQREGDQESGEERSLKAWPPPAPGEQPRSGETNKKSGEGKPMGASIWPPPKPPPGTQHDRDRDLPSNIRVAHPRPDSPSGSVRSDADSAHPHAGSVHPRGEGGTSEGGQRAQHREGGGSGKDYPQDGRPSGQRASDGGERREGGGASGGGGGGGAETAVRRQDSVPTGKRKGEDVDSEMSESKRPAQEERMTRDPMEAEGARPHPSQKEAVGGHMTQGQPGAAGNGGYGDVAMATGPDADGEKEAPRKRSGVTGRHGYPPYRPRPDQFQLPVWTEFASETEYEELGRGGDLQIPTSVTLSEASDRTEIGRWGELLVYDYLQKQKEMCSEIYDIIWANDVAESGKPYDFEVVCTTEDEAFSLFIEVKATRSSKKEVFEISSNEVKFASEHGERYHIYRIFSAGNTGQVQLVRLTNVTHRMDTKEVRLLMVI